MSIATRACVSEPSLISMFQAITGSDVPVCVTGGAGDGDTKPGATAATVT
jgi:hypothetical protein